MKGDLILVEWGAQAFRRLEHLTNGSTRLMEPVYVTSGTLGFALDEEVLFHPEYYSQHEMFVRILLVEDGPVWISSEKLKIVRD